MNPVAGRGVLFRTIALGEAEPTVDFMVFLLDQNNKQGSEFFFLQVKTTEVGPRHDGSYACSFSAREVQRARAMKVPFFICVVDRSDPSVRRIFIKGVDSKRHAGTYSVAPLYDLKTDTVKVTLYEEVKRIWAMQKLPRLQELV